VKKIIRNILTFFPGLQDLRFATQKRMRSAFNSYYEEDYAHLNKFQGINNYVDIGANRGDTIHDVLRIFPDTKIVGFEPNVALFNKLEKQLSKHKNVTIHNTGLGNSNEVRDFYLPKYRNYIFDGLGSFQYEATVSLLRLEIPNFNEDLVTVDKHQFKVQKLDDFNLTPDFIKIDVQGYEYLALKGGEQTISKYKPILLIETPGKDIIEYLESLNYMHAYLVNGKFVKGRGDLNTFFFNKDNIKKYFDSPSILAEAGFDVKTLA